MSGNDSVNEITAAMMEVELAPSTTTTPPVEGQGKVTLDPELASLINDMSGGAGRDQKLLQKAADAVKAFLRRNKDSLGVGVLMEHRGFIPFFVKCLKNNANNPSLQFNAAWIMEVIATHGKKSEVSLVVDAGAIPLLVKLINVTEKTIYEQVVAAMARVATNDGSRDKLISLMGNFLSPLVKLLEHKNLAEQFIMSVSRILRGMIFRETDKDIQDSNERRNPIYSIYADILESRVKLSALDMKNLVSVLVTLLNSSSEEQLRNEALYCLTVVIIICRDMKTVISSGVCSKLVSLLSHPNEQVQIAAVVAIGKIAKAGKKELVAFLETMKESQGLKAYVNCFKMDLEKSRQLIEGVNNLANGALLLVSDASLTMSQVNVLMESGLFYALVQCLKEKECPIRYYTLAIQVMCCVTRKLPTTKRHLLISDPENLPILIETLKSPHDMINSNAQNILLLLVEKNPSCRDTLVAHGIIPTLIGIDNGTDVNYSAKLRILSCLGYIIGVQPYASVEHYKEIPAVLEHIMIPSGNVTQFQHARELSLGVVTLIASHGNDGVEMIIQQENLLTQIISYLGKRYKDVNFPAIMAVKTLAGGTQAQRNALMEAGCLKHFMHLLQTGNPFTRQSTLETMLLFLNGDLTPTQRLAIHRSSPLVLLEMTKRNPITGPAALEVFDAIAQFALDNTEWPEEDSSDMESELD